MGVDRGGTGGGDRMGLNAIIAPLTAGDCGCTSLINRRCSARSRLRCAAGLSSLIGGALGRLLIAEPSLLMPYTVEEVAEFSACAFGGLLGLI